MTGPATPSAPDGPASAARNADADVAPETRDAAVRPGNVSERMAALEAELAFQTDANRELSDAMAQQQLDILTLQRQVQYLSEQLVALRNRERPDSADAPDDEVPPHY